MHTYTHTLTYTYKQTFFCTASTAFQEVPYIYEDRVSKESFIEALVEMFNKTGEERKEMGKKGREYVLRKYDLNKFAKTWEETMDAFMEKHGSWATRKNYKSWTTKEF